MEKWKILITDGLEETGLAILRAEVEVESREVLPAEELLQIIGDYEALVVRGRTKVTGQVFLAGSKLKVVGRAGVGVDNIDLAAANARGVTVVNSPLATSQAVAEHTLGLMLALARSIPLGDAGMKSGQWLKKELLGVEVQGKVLGVIGMGNIGSTVARLAAALSMQVIGFDPLVPPAEIQQCGAEPVTLGELYNRSDFITIHVPLTQETKGMINGQSLGHMKRGVRLVCAARGGVIDETALLGALESGQVAGAALDVFAQEPPGVSALVTHPAVVATPHIGAQTVEAQARAARDIALEVLSALKGEPLRWRVV
ncbi:MAG TPA: hydroxyacid dehydrogenase [Anaerolineales bacterium]